MAEKPARGGYMGTLLWVSPEADSDRDRFEIISVEDKVYREFLTRRGLGANIISERQNPGVDPLSGENTLGMMTGLLTGTNFKAMGSDPDTLKPFKKVLDDPGLDFIKK
ncbi:MAG: hypothetical protein GY757_60890, partial [bacterium]|nr:hypothetical protein [bacterium]